MRPLTDIIADELGPPEKRVGERLYWLCPFHVDSDPSLSVLPRNPDFSRERWYCYGCKQHGDAIDFLRRRHPHLSFQQAAKAAGRNSRSTASSHRHSFTQIKQFAPEKPDPPEQWQKMYKNYILSCAKDIWENDNEQLLSYLLEDRGLTYETIDKAKLGALIERYRGISIPWMYDGVLRHVSVRHFPGGQCKYSSFTGGSKGTMYPSDKLIYRNDHVVVLVEGEFDALLMRQELLQFGVQAFTLGSVTQAPTARIVNNLLNCPSVFIGFDADEAGDRAFTKWKQFLPKAERLRPPEGCDWTDVHLCAEGGLKAYFGFERIDILDRYRVDPRTPRQREKARRARQEVIERRRLWDTHGKG